MVWEIAELTIKSGHETAFEAALQEARPLFTRAKGCISMQVQRSIERPQLYRLIVEWETLEDHTVTFRNSQDFLRWRELAGPHFEVPPHVEHTTRVL